MEPNVLSYDESKRVARLDEYRKKRAALSFSSLAILNLVTMTITLNNAPHGVVRWYEKIYLYCAILFLASGEDNPIVELKHYRRIGKIWSRVYKLTS